MRYQKETDYQFLCRQIDKCIELLQDLKTTEVIPCSTWSEQEKEKGKIVKSRVKELVNKLMIGFLNQKKIL